MAQHKRAAGGAVLGALLKWLLSGHTLAALRPPATPHKQHGVRGLRCLGQDVVAGLQLGSARASTNRGEEGHTHYSGGSTRDRKVPLKRRQQNGDSPPKAGPIQGARFRCIQSKCPTSGLLLPHFVHSAPLPRAGGTSWRRKQRRASRAASRAAAAARRPRPFAPFAPRANRQQIAPLCRAVCFPRVI